MRNPSNFRRYEPLHAAYLRMLRHHEARGASEARPADGSPAACIDGARVGPSLRALLSACGLAAGACRLTVRGLDPDGMVVVDVDGGGRSLSLHLRLGGHEAEASPAARS